MIGLAKLAGLIKDYPELSKEASPRNEQEDIWLDDTWATTENCWLTHTCTWYRRMFQGWRIKVYGTNMIQESNIWKCRACRVPVPKQVVMMLKMINAWEKTITKSEQMYEFSIWDDSDR